MRPPLVDVAARFIPHLLRDPLRRLERENSAFEFTCHPQQCLEQP
jgi:hypothetical protein